MPTPPPPEPPARRPGPPPPRDAPTPGPAAATGGPGRPEELLAAAHREATERLAGLTGHFRELVAASANSNADDEHDPEGATIAFERSQLDSLVTRTRGQLAEIDAARGRLARGDYGVCEACGRPVGDARLEALPAARTCIACATRMAQSRAGRHRR